MKVTGQPHVVRAEKDTTNKTCRHWYLRVQTDQGRKQKRFVGTYTEAKRAAQEFATTICVPQGKMPFRELAEKWLDRRSRSGKLAETTIYKDKSILKRLVDQFGDMTLCNLTYSVLTDGMLDIKESGNLGNTYMTAMYEKLSAVLDMAVKEGELSRNPALDVDRPRRDKTQRKALTSDQLIQFLTTLNIRPMTVHTVAMRILVLGGLRRGESVGLNWADVDFERNRICISRSITDAGKVKEPKTSAGIRTIPMMRSLTTLLMDWQKLQETQLSVIRIKQTLDTPVLTSTVGTRLNPQNLDRWWRKNRASYGLDGVVIHEMRHTLATLLANNGTALTSLMDIFGWDDITMANTYVHHDEAKTREAMDKLDSLLDSIV